MVARRSAHHHPRYAPKRARVGSYRSPLRYRHQHPLFLDPHLLPCRVESRGLVPSAVPAVVEPEGPRRRVDHRIPLLRVGSGSRARALARGAKIPDVRFVDHPFPSGWGREPQERTALGYLATVNLYLAAFNMIPGFPLDGGRVLRSAIWGISGDRTRATTIAARGGQVVAVAFGAFVFYEVIVLHDASGVWFGLIAYFLWNAASSSLQQERIASVVGGAKVGPLMTTDFKSTPPGVMVGQVIRDLVLPMNLRAIPVVSGDRLIGLVAIGDLRKVDQSRWVETLVEQVMTPASELPTVSPDDPLGTALERFSSTELPLLPVIKDGRLVGILYRESVIGYLRMQEMLRAESRR
ncbi:MAG: CBS domain-containing protein [Chloroflexi bacterium]|nr:MAG: CBS domain-containing protein [Chloroflexota bacterium]